MIICEIITKIPFFINNFIFNDYDGGHWLLYSKFEAARGFYFYPGFENDFIIEIQEEIKSWNKK